MTSEMTEPGYPPMPQHDKLHARKEQHETLVDFLEWLSDRGIVLVRLDDVGRVEEYLAKPTLIADYLGIDEDAFYAEKEALYKHISAQAQKG